MAESANVTSVEVLDRFRSRMIVYQDKATITMDEVSDTIKRVRLWLQHDQPAFWKGQIRRIEKQLEEAEAALFSSRLSASREPSAHEQMQVQKLRRKLREAEDKLRVVKQWSRNFDSRVEPLAKKLEGVNYLLATDVPKGIAFLAQAAKALHAYAGSKASVSEESVPQTRDGDAWEAEEASGENNPNEDTGGAP